ncbi:ABC transporter permease [Nocardioides sp. P86]|uniref:ABC transporter permease n=1 Tax=Nocardioides sp. P86 TaxID=2939569 RepID=UPI00203EBCE9|nr:ABC transporter permease [Nocardioides sp. P86]MCM3515378.1 ABC transporter permease [Nocardioides sp. P86]
MSATQRAVPAATGTFVPRPGAAPLGRQVLAQARMEARLTLRNGEQLLLAVVIPVIVLIGGVLAADRVGLDLEATPVDVFTPGVLALAVMSTAFTSLAIATGFERRYGVIKRLGTSPLPRSGLLAGKVLALLLVEVLQVAVIAAVALALGWRPVPGADGSALGAVTASVLAVVLGTAAFASLGLFVAGVLRAEATLAAANLVYLLLMAGGAVVLPASAYGGFGEVVGWLPSGALGGAMRDALIDGQVAWPALLVLAAWTVVGTVATARTFTWE